jgi:putative hydrolase of the HAD superfamily
MTPSTPFPTRAILFDLDDTILAYDAASTGCWETACAHFATRLNGVLPQDVVDGIRRQSDWFWSDPERFRQGRLNLERARQQVVSAVFAELGIPDGGLATDLARLRTEIHEQRIAPFPGAIDALRALQSRKVRMALVTNGASDKQRAKIDRYALAVFFDCIVVEGEFGCGKPDERVFRHALSRLDVPPEDAWMVGDNLLHDIAPAQALGMTGIWHDHRGSGLPNRSPCAPVRVIRRLSDLLPGDVARDRVASGPRAHA